MKHSNRFSVKEKAKNFITNFNISESKKKLKEIFFEINDNQGGFFNSFMNNYLNESYLNIRYKNNLCSYYKEYLFHYELYSKFLNEYQGIIKKESLVDFIIKIDLDKLDITPVNYYDKNKGLDQIIKIIKLSFDSPFSILRNFSQFMDIDIQEISLIKYFNQFKKTELYEMKIFLNEPDFIGISNNKLKYERTSKAQYLSILKDTLDHESHLPKNLNNPSADKAKCKAVDAYFSVDKIILRELTENISKNNINSANEDDQEIYEKINFLQYKIENKYQSNFNNKDLSLSTEKISLKNFKLFHEEFNKIHNLLNYKSKYNLLMSFEENLNKSKTSEAISFFKKNSCRFLQAEKFGFRSIKINCGPGDLYFIGIPSESKNEFIRIIQEEYCMDPLNSKYEVFPDLDFFLSHKIKFHIFILKKGDILNMQSGAFNMYFI